MRWSIWLGIFLATASLSARAAELDQAKDLYWAGELQQALAEVESYLEENPDDVEATAWKGSILGSMAAGAETTGDAARYGLAAIAQLKKALRMDPDCATALLGMGFVKLKTPEMYGGNLDEAIPFFLAASERTDDPAMTCAIHVGLAETYLGKKQRDRAVIELEAALAVDPEWAEAKTLLQGLRSYRPDARIAAISVQGNELTRREFIVRGLTFEAGDVLDLDELDANEAHWRESGHFAEVDMSVRAIHSDEHVVVDIEVAEHPPWEWGPWPARLAHQNLFGRKHSLGAEFFLDKEWETEVIERPYLWGFVHYGIDAHPDIGVGLDSQAGYSYVPYITRRGDPGAAEMLSAYTLQTGWIEVGVSYAISDHVTVGLRDRLHVFDVEATDRSSADPYFLPDDGTSPDNHVVTYLDMHWPWPRQRPVADLEILLEQTLGETSLGARYDFSKTRVQLINRWHLAKKLGLVVRLEGGTSFGTIPHWLQFACGGDLGLRGYTVFDHVGTRMLLATVELRIDALTLLNGNMVWQIVPLFDIGNAWAVHEAFSLDVSQYPLDYGLGVNLWTAPGRSFRFRMHGTVNRENEFTFVVALYPPL